jgi:hypothetical protein
LLRRRTRAALAVFFSLAACLAAPTTLFAAQVKIPLHINYLVLTEALRQQLYAKDGRAQLWSGNNACEYLYATNPVVGQHQAMVQIDTDGNLNLGVAVGDQCLSPISWSGIIEADAAPYIVGFALKFRITDVNLYDHNHQKTALIGRGFDLIKGSVVPALETFSFDLAPAIHELENLAQMAATPGNGAARLSPSTVRFEPAVIAEGKGLQLTLDIELPAQSLPTPMPASEAPLTPDEIAAWNTALDNWDAFLVFAIKQIGATVHDPDFRSELFNILVNGRERLVAALAQPQHVSGPDPVRMLFLDEWKQLGDLIETAAAQGKLGSRSLEFLSFISAGDALFALDQAAPMLGMTISAADLRRLARIMAPQASGDPLAYGFDEDPQLREMFGIGAPLGLPGNFEVPEQPASAPTPDQTKQPSPGATNASPATGLAAPGAVWNESSLPPLTVPRPTPPNKVRRQGRLRYSILRGARDLSAAVCAIAPKAAAAAEVVPNTRVNAHQIVNLGLKLRSVVVGEQNALLYRSELDQLLGLAAQYELEDGVIRGTARDTWPVLLKAAAWQESCWRQFIIKHRRVWYLESKSGDIGLMQVNKYVWRGFYSLPRLRWDIVYNAGAGAQILMRFFIDSSRHLHSNNPAELARGAYAAYNGGPGAYNRWRQPHEPKLWHEIDQAFWLKYRAVASGASFDILRCAADWDRLGSG